MTPEKRRYQREFKAREYANPERREVIKARARKYYHNNKEKRRAYDKIWREKNRDRLNELNRLSYARNGRKCSHGVRPKEKALLLEKQGGCCAICGTSDPNGRGWAVDHCHKTDFVRGILCNNCNLALGHVGDNVAVLKKMIEYLMRHAPEMLAA